MEDGKATRRNPFQLANIPFRPRVHFRGAGELPSFVQFGFQEGHDFVFICYVDRVMRLRDVHCRVAHAGREGSRRAPGVLFCRG